MKIQLEEIKPDIHSSFRLLINPRLNDFFYWHFHPEYELVYIEGVNGTRHVGDHMSNYEYSDLVFIGSNIPHLNFDYGVKGDYEKIVVHIRLDFLGNAFAHTPELHKIQQLFEESKRGLGFGKQTKQLLAKRIKKLNQLEYFPQFIEMLNILSLLTQAEDKFFLHERPFENKYKQKEQERLKKLYQFIDQNYQRKISVEEAAKLCHLSNAAFCRYVKKMTLLTFTDFLNHYRINHAKRLLLTDKTVTECCFECGFESLSYFNRTFKKITGENPSAFRKRYRKGSSF